MALPTTEGRTLYQNPLRVFLNEALTFYENGVSQFIEMMRHFFRDDATMEGYSVIVAETSSNAKGIVEDQLYVKVAFNLESASFREGQQYGSIGRHPSEANGEDLMAWKPNHKTLRAPNPTITTSHNFLSVADFQMEVIFLVYCDNQTIFDADVWPKNHRSGRKMPLKGPLYDFIQKHTVDAMVISGLGAPDMIQGVKKIFCKMFDFDFSLFSLPYAPGCNEVESTTTSVSVGFPLSINRCGSQNLPFLFNSYKHGTGTKCNISYNCQHLH